MNRQHAHHTQLRRRLAVLVAGLVLSATAAAGPQGPGADRGRDMEAKLDRMTEQLALTEAQRDQIQAIFDEQRAATAERRQQTRARIDAVLTDEQRAERDSLQAQRMDRRLERMADRLDLTESQQEQIRAIWGDKQADTARTPGALRERIDAVLTDEQREQLAARGGRRHGGGPRHGGGDRGEW